MSLKEYEVMAGNCVYHDGKLCEPGDIIKLTEDQAQTHGENLRLPEPTTPAKKNGRKSAAPITPEEPASEEPASEEPETQEGG